MHFIRITVENNLKKSILKKEMQISEEKKSVISPNPLMVRFKQALRH